MNEQLKNYESFCKCTLSQVEHDYDIRSMSLKFVFLQQIYILIWTLHCRSTRNEFKFKTARSFSVK